MTDLDIDPPTDTDADLHRGSSQSIVTIDEGDWRLALCVDQGAGIDDSGLARALRVNSDWLARIAVVESTSPLPPADAVREQLEPPLRADGAGAYPCVLCGRGHPTTGAALACCSERFDDADLVTDGGTTRCGRRTCDDEAAVTYTTIRGAIRTRCDVHALADAVDGVGDSRAESILDADAERESERLVPDGGEP